MNKFLQSSSNPDNLSLTIKGLQISIPAVLIAIFGLLGLDIAESAVLEISQHIFLFAGAIVSSIGALRKVINWIKTWTIGE